MDWRGKAADALDTPLMHMTAVGHAREILREGAFRPKACKVFKEDLVYFFVARPAYRLKHGARKSAQLNAFPCLFMARGDTLGAPRHVYPMDTGALDAGVFGDNADPYVCLEDYELQPELLAATRHIAWAFGDLEAYFRGDLRAGLSETIADWDAVGVAFAKLARLGSPMNNARPDLRASTVEVAYAEAISLKDAVEYAILPKQFLESRNLENSEFLDLLMQLGIAWDVYDWQPNKTPNDYNDEIQLLIYRRLFG